MSDQIRYGKIINMDASDNIGTIVDENQQEIDFLLSEQDETVSLFDRVSFVIHFAERRLRADQVKRVLYYIVCSSIWIQA